MTLPHTVPRRSALAVVLVALVALLAGCGSSQEPAASAQYSAIVDVRTPAEFAQGHVEDAVNIDVQSPAFTQEITSLPRDGTYLVYCRSGNRSAAAADAMRSAGLDVADGGGLEDMKNAGFAVTG